MYRLVHFTAIAKTHFNFGGVHIHIHAVWVHVQVQGIHRLSLSVQHVFIGASRRMGQHFVADITAIDIGVLVVGTLTRSIGHTGTRTHAHIAVLLVNP